MARSETAAYVFNLFCMLAALAATVVVPIMHGAPRGVFLTFPAILWLGSLTCFHFLPPHAVRRADALRPATALWVWTQPAIQLAWIMPVVRLNVLLWSPNPDRLGPTASSMLQVTYSFNSPWVATGVAAMLWLALWTVVRRWLGLDRFVFITPATVFLVTLFASAIAGVVLNFLHIDALSAT